MKEKIDLDRIVGLDDLMTENEYIRRELSHNHPPTPDDRNNEWVGWVVICGSIYLLAQIIHACLAH